ncbi:MAG: ferrous iron transport protein B [Thermoplasmata archaeon]|nr:MAG: ferrous iron transport protein B [Thermoplasmata archaeon]
MKVLLVGQPNVGKSSLINALTGAKVIISNYPGTTIDVTEGKTKINGIEYTFIDTPGVYNLFPSSLEEKVTEEMILNGEYDFIIQVMDAISIERSLVITMSLIELGVPLLLAINFWEEAEKKGIEVDEKKLEKMLGVKVVKINPIKRGGIRDLIKNIGEARKSNFKITYDDDIEIAIQETMKKLKETKLSKRGIAVKILEGDEIAIKKYGIDAEDVIEKIKRHPNLAIDIQITKSGYASIISKNVVKLRARKEKLNRFDKFLFSNWLAGFTLTSFILAITFAILIYLGGWFQDELMGLANEIINFLMPYVPSYLSLIIKEALTGLSAGIAIAIPYIGIFYFLLSIMEDSGILARFIIVLNSMMKKIGLPGKSIIPVMLGLGCSVAAIKSSRLLASARDRLKVAFLFSMVPCSSRTAIILGIVSHYAGISYGIAIYIIALVLFIVTAKLLDIVIKKEPMPIIEELPPYRLPKIKNVVAKSWIRMKSFVYVVIPLLIIGGMLYGLLLHLSLIDFIVKPLSPITRGWLMLPEESVMALFYGFLQKDLTPAMLANALGTLNFNAAMTKLQIFTFGMASTFQIPCIIAFAMIGKELGWKNAILIEIAALAYGLIVTGLILRLLMLWH